MSLACSDTGHLVPNAERATPSSRSSPRQLGLPQYSNWSVMSLFSLSNNLTFEKDLLPTSGKLLSYVCARVATARGPRVSTDGSSLGLGI